VARMDCGSLSDFSCPMCLLYRQENLAPSTLSESVPLGVVVENRNADGFFDAQTILDVIYAILVSDSRSQVVADRSQQNPTGFRKIVLTRCASGHQLRVHIWDDAVLNPEIRCHNHRWDFLSMVIRGTIMNDTYLAVQGTGFRKFAVGIGPPMQQRDMSDLGPTDLLLAGSDEINSGGAYFQSALKFHWTRVAGPAATIVMQDRARRSYSVAIERGPLRDVPSPAMSVDALQDDLQSCLQAIAGLRADGIWRSQANNASESRPWRWALGQATPGWRLGRPGSR
jgi:hypothetical protein